MPIKGASAGSMHVDSASFPAVVLVDLNTRRSKAGAHFPSVCKPVHTGSGVSNHCGVINIPLHCEHARDPIEVCEDRVHCHAEKEDRERPSHIHPSDDHFRGQQFALNLMSASAEEQDMSSVHDDPQGSFAGGKDL